MKIVLIGFMGSGKSSVARVLSEKLGLELIEMDDLVLRKSGRVSITEIFEKDGEPVFRHLENTVAESLQNKKNVIISTGGGIVENKIIFDYLRKNGKIIYLSASFAEIENRLKDDTARPLFKNKDNAKKLYDTRKKLYGELADKIVETDNKSVEEVTVEITEKLNEIR